MNNKISPVPVSASTDQQIPYSIPSVSGPYISPQITSFQNPSAFQVMNSQYNPQQQTSTSETIKPFVLMPQVTTLPLFTSPESSNISAAQGSTIPSAYSLQSANNQEFSYQSPTAFPPQSYSQHDNTTLGDTTTISDIPKSKELSNYFSPQIQTQVSSSNNSSTIPMFSVKNFPQMSPLAQPLGKLFQIFYFISINIDTILHG